MPVIDLGRVVGPQGADGSIGPQGPTGSSGPNLIDTNTRSNVNGVLSGVNGYVRQKALDDTPTSGSSNLLTSGAVYNALASRASYDPASFDNAGGKTITFTRKAATVQGCNLISVWTRTQGGATNNHWVALWVANFSLLITLSSASGAVTIDSVSTRALTITLPSAWGNVAINSIGEPLSSIAEVTT